MAGLVHRQNGEKPIEKHIGCMPGFLQIFDRQQTLARKRIHSANSKPIRSSTDVGASPETTSSGDSPEKGVVVVEPASPAENENGQPTVDGDDNQSRPPGVIARLMGLEPSPSSDQKTQTVNKSPALPRSPSESRVLKNLGHSKYIDGNNFQLKQPNQNKLMSEYSRTCPRNPRTFFNSGELFPEPNQTTATKLKIRGIDEQLKDLNTLKHILEVLQLKGLLQSTDSSKVTNQNLNLTESSDINPPKHNLIKKVVTDDESATDSERSRWENCRDGKRLLERCRNLLNSIAEMNNATESLPSSVTVIPSPVSVLDSGFDKDESSSPSNGIDFKATSTVDFEEDNTNWSPDISPTEHEEFISDDSDFIYISNILRASQHLRDDSAVFFSIEKQFHDSDNTSPVSKRHRKLVFAVIGEILDKNKQLPPWKSSIEYYRTSIKQLWHEFEKIREMVITTGTGDGLLKLISGVLKKDFVDIKDWEDYPIETSEVILDTERLIFKDLVSEAIRDLVEYSGECKFSGTRRKLVF